MAILCLVDGSLVLTRDLAQLLGLLPLDCPVVAACAVPIITFEI